jgi:hypothetical protein
MIMMLSGGSVIMFPWQPNHMTTVADTHATIEELLEVVVSVGFMLRLYARNENEWLYRWADESEVSGS